MIELFYALGGLGGLAILIWITRSIKRWGAAEHKLAQSEKEKTVLHKQVEIIKDAKTIHDRVERDPAYRDNVRDLYR